MKKRNKMHDIIYRLRKNKSINIDTKNRMIYYEYQNEEDKMRAKPIERLCKEFGFGRQAVII